MSGRVEEVPALEKTKGTDASGEANRKKTQRALAKKKGTSLSPFRRQKSQAAKRRASGERQAEIPEFRRPGVSWKKKGKADASGQKEKGFQRRAVKRMSKKAGAEGD